MESLDHTRMERMGDWLHHPSLGDPSWDAFVRLANNPIHTGREPYWWPVNGTLFRDPISGQWYAYVSVYPRGYWPPPPADALILREDRNGRWTEVGYVFGASRPPYARKDGRLGAATDVSVVFHDGAYHALFGWCDPENKRGGLGYARAERPEGPFVCSDEPIHDDARQKPIFGRYVRAYASTLIRRRGDWLILHMMSTPGNAGGTWGLFAMVARAAEGPYSAPAPLVLPQTQVYHPPLAEFFPAFVHGGRVYAPATSVAANRSWQVLFSAPLERAHEQTAWRLDQEGSLWHNVPDAWEVRGIWGQTLACAVTPSGTLRAMYPAKSREDVGAVGLAERPWTKPHKHGFAVGGPNARSYAVLRRAFATFHLEAVLEAAGSWKLCWACRGPLGPDHPWADSRPQALMGRDRVEWRWAAGAWQLVRVAADGSERLYAEGMASEFRMPLLIQVSQQENELTLGLAGRSLWTGKIPAAIGRIELVAEEGSYISADRFAVAGIAQTYEEVWLASDALAGYGVPAGEWTALTTPGFRFGTGYETTTTGARAKWNVQGIRLELWAPRGARYGVGQLILDGAAAARIDFRADRDVPSAPLWSQAVPDGRHALILEAVDGAVPCDCLSVQRHA